MKKFFIILFCIVLIVLGYNSFLDKKIENYVNERVTVSYSDFTENTLIQEKEEVENEKNTENNANYEEISQLTN